MAETTTTGGTGAPAPVVNELTPAQTIDLNAFVANWRQIARKEPPNREEVEGAVSRLYKSIELEVPPVIWCDGPWQYVATKALIKLYSLRDDAGAELIDSVISKLTELPQWQKVWDRLSVLIQENKLICEKADEQSSFSLPLSHEMSTKVIQAITSAKEKLNTALSLPVKLHLRRAFRQDNNEQQNARFRLAAPNRQIVTTQFGLLSIGLFIDNRLPQEFIDQLTPELKTQLAALCAQTWPDTPNPLARKQDPLTKLFSAESERLQSFDDVIELQPVAFFVQHVPELLPTEVKIPVNDWLTLKEQLFHGDLDEKLCILCECPYEAILNERNQLNNQSGPAMKFRDGSEVFAWNGVVLPSAAVTSTDRLTIDLIEKEQNIEVRRILIQQYGIERYLNDSNAVKIDEDEFGVLYRKSQVFDEPIVVVRVLNPTPEPDGTNKFYFLRVPPFIKTARQAVAWTFDMDEKEYEPSKQS